MGQGASYESDSVWKAIAKRELTLCREGHRGDMGSDLINALLSFQI